MWPEVGKALDEKRHELVCGGGEITKRLQKEGLETKIFELSWLNFLDIHDTCLDNIPEEISQLKELQSLVLNSNQLTVLPAKIGELKKLKLLDVSRNKLQEIPVELNDLSNIVTLNLSNNVLQTFPQLSQTVKLTVLDLSSNKLTSFPDICHKNLGNLSEIKLNDNEIATIPGEISVLSNLKLLELSKNLIKTIPGELADCTKLKSVELKNNPICDKRLLKLIEQCRTKQIIDYVKSHSPKTTVEKAVKAGGNAKKDTSQESDDDTQYKYVLTVNCKKEGLKIIIDSSVKTVRGFLVACLVTGVQFDAETFKKFIQIQNKLHEGVCNKRNNATIATHDFDKLPPGDLTYTTLPPEDLMIQPLNRRSSLSGSDLFRHLQTQAENLRKEKKRNTYSGIHKYLYLIEGQSRYPCLWNANKEVISFPPITNSELSRISPETKNVLVEVTSSLTLHACKLAMEELLKEWLQMVNKLEVVQVRSVDEEGHLKVAYPSKTDLVYPEKSIKVNRLT